MKTGPIKVYVTSVPGSTKVSFLICAQEQTLFPKKEMMISVSFFAVSVFYTPDPSNACRNWFKPSIENSKLWKWSIFCVFYFVNYEGSATLQIHNSCFSPSQIDRIVVSLVLFTLLFYTYFPAKETAAGCDRHVGEFTHSFRAYWYFGSMQSRRPQVYA